MLLMEEILQKIRRHIDYGVRTCGLPVSVSCRVMLSGRSRHFSHRWTQVFGRSTLTSLSTTAMASQRYLWQPKVIVMSSDHPYYQIPWLKVNLDHMLKLWRQLSVKIHPTIRSTSSWSLENHVLQNMSHCLSNKKGFWSKGFPNNFFSLVPKSTTTATTSTSTTRCNKFLRSKGDACFLAVHFGGLVFLAFFLMRHGGRETFENWKKKYERNESQWNHTTVGGIQDCGGFHFILTNHIDTFLLT